MIRLCDVSQNGRNTYERERAMKHTREPYTVGTNKLELTVLFLSSERDFHERIKYANNLDEIK